MQKNTESASIKSPGRILLVLINKDKFSAALIQHFPVFYLAQNRLDFVM